MTSKEFIKQQAQLLLFAIATPMVIEAQEDVLLEDLLASVPSAPPGLPIPTLSDKATIYQTGEGFDFQVKVVTTGLNFPWNLLT